LVVLYTSYESNLQKQDPFYIDITLYRLKYSFCEFIW